MVRSVLYVVMCPAHPCLSGCGLRGGDGMDDPGIVAGGLRFCVDIINSHLEGTSGIEDCDVSRPQVIS